MDDKIIYDVVRSSRKTIAIQISSDGRVTVRAPKQCSRETINGLIRKKENWILEKLEEIQARRQRLEQQKEEQPRWSESDYHKARELACRVFEQKTALYADLMEVTYGHITIRDQKTRWGSCSAKGNLNFNWRLILAPEEVQDYVVIHELAHRKEMNHSERFWHLVESMMPDYQRQRLWLKQNGNLLMSR